jgi:hypothetical protein
MTSFANQFEFPHSSKSAMPKPNANLSPVDSIPSTLKGVTRTTASFPSAWGALTMPTIFTPGIPS